MKTAVIYRSMTGHSKKLARAVAAATNSTAQDIKLKPTLDRVDILFVVGGIYSGASMADTLDFIGTLDETNARRAALITSSAQDKAGQDQVRKLLENNGIEVIDEYRCRGSFLFLQIGHPTKQEIQGAADFAKSKL